METTKGETNLASNLKSEYELFRNKLKGNLLYEIKRITGSFEQTIDLIDHGAEVKLPSDEVDNEMRLTTISIKNKEELIFQADYANGLFINLRFHDIDCETAIFLIEKLENESPYIM